MATIQPDLFGEYDAAQENAAAREALKPRWRAWLQAEPMPVPWDTQGGAVKGEVSTDWWRCPGCGAVDFGAYTFWLSHGLHPDHVGDVPWAWENHGGCHQTIGRQGAAIGEPGTEPS
jgi:hypothetical protein